MSKTNYLENKILDHIMGITAYTMPTGLWLSAFITAPSEGSGGTEAAGGSFARVDVTGKFSASSGGASANTEEISFPTATANWGEIFSVGIFDAASGGNLLRYMPLTTPEGDPTSVVVHTGETITFAAGNLTFAETNSGKTDYLKDKMLDHMLGIASYTKPTVWLAAFYGIPGVNESAEEINSHGYARMALADLLSAANNGVVTNGSEEVSFPVTVGGSWGEISSVATFDASSGGNMLRVSPLSSPVLIGENQYLLFPVSALSFAED